MWMFWASAWLGGSSCWVSDGVDSWWPWHYCFFFSFFLYLGWKLCVTQIVWILWIISVHLVSPPKDPSTGNKNGSHSHKIIWGCPIKHTSHYDFNEPIIWSSLTHLASNSDLFWQQSIASTYSMDIDLLIDFTHDFIVRIRIVTSSEDKYWLILQVVIH